MIRNIMRDVSFLSQPSEPADGTCTDICDDLLETLQSHRTHCVGMAANMIGVRKAIIVFDDNGKYCEMLNPQILKGEGLYEAEEGCLSLVGKRKTQRYRSIKVLWFTREMKPRIRKFEGFTAQIIQHEIDHLSGKII